MSSTESRIKSIPKRLSDYVIDIEMDSDVSALLRQAANVLQALAALNSEAIALYETLGRLAFRAVPASSSRASRKG